MTLMLETANDTERMIAAMLVENTGAAMMDSGMHGRAWQMTRAAYGLDGGLPNSTFHGGPGHAAEAPGEDDIARVARLMRDGPQGSIDSYGSVSISTFHWLVDRLEYKPDLDARYQRFTRVVNWGKDSYDSDWGLPVMDRFVELLDKHTDVSGGIYPGEGGTSSTTNTYNEEYSLDRTLQWTAFHVEQDDFLPEGTYMLLQVHGGADVRGGYTDPRLFVVDGDGMENIYDFDRVSVWCDGGDPNPDIPRGQATLDESEIDHDGQVHWWENSYGDGHLRREAYPSEDKVLCFPYSWKSEEERDEEIATLKEKGVDTNYGPNHPADIARWDDDTKAWRCPIDDSPLHTGPNLVG